MEIRSQMTKITKCPIFFDAKILLVASKAHFFHGSIAQYFLTFFIEHPVVQILMKNLLRKE